MCRIGALVGLNPAPFSKTLLTLYSNCATSYVSIPPRAADVSTTSVAQSHSSTVSSPSNASNGLTTATTTGSIASLQMPPGLKLPLPQQPGCRPPELMPERKTAHNAIERKYRLSINDRINDLRQIITQGDEEMGKKVPQLCFTGVY